MTRSPLPEGYSVRPLRELDLARVQTLLDECETHDAGEPVVHEMDLAVEAGGPRFDQARNTWIVTAPDGRLAAAGWLWSPETEGTEITGDHYIHPDHRDTTVDARLVDLMEARAADLAAGHPSVEKLVLFASDAFADCGADLLARGYRRAHDLYCMRIDLTPQQAPRRSTEWPAGIAVRPIRPDVDARACWEADEEAFSEHYLFEPTPYDEWRRRSVERDGLDPSLWLVAWDGDDVAGMAWGLPRGREVYVQDLSVRRQWRGRGLGLALLRELFAILAERGLPFVRLFVDAQNVTGALRVYERAGMRVERRFGAFEKAVGDLPQTTGSA